MAGDFDPYYKWLGIPPAEQPPDCYRLLGVQTFEADPEVIASAADQRMAHVRSFQAGQHSELSQKVLNEIAAARVCLLNAAKKAEYDAQLRRRREAKSAWSKPVEPPSPPAADAGFDLADLAYSSPKGRTAKSARPRSAAGPRTRKKQSSLAWQLPLAGVIAAAVVVVGFLLMQGGPQEKQRPGRGEPTAKMSNTRGDPSPPTASKPTTPGGAAHRPPPPDEPPLRVPDPPPLEKPKPGKPKPPPGPAKEPTETVEDRLKSDLAKAQTPEELRSFARQALGVAGRAAAEGNRPLAKEAATLALVAARKCKDSELANQATLRVLGEQP
jgi:hypothetical protein